MRHWAFIVGGIASVGAACGGALPDTMKGQSGMLDAAGVKQKCEEASKNEQRPFVVDWDVTDVSSFERKAARDTVFVRYEGCKLEILPQCRDPDRAAAFGAYTTPDPSTGGTKQIDIQNEGELYAKLPLGAATFGGKVAAGEELHLKYHVTGEAATTRESVYKGELAKYQGCKGATHFIYAYNVGAFELSTSERGAREIGASYAGAGGGAHQSSSKAVVGKVGDLASCTSNDQRACLAPIRLTLREVLDGDAPDGAPTTKQVVGGSAVDVSQPFDFSKTATGEAFAMLDEVKPKFEARDGAACMRLIDKAITKDKKLATPKTMEMRALCQMMVGECDKGGKAYREALTASVHAGYGQRNLTDRDLEERARELGKVDARVADAQAHHCPASSASGTGDYLDRLLGEASQAFTKKAVDACKSHFQKAEAAAATVGNDEALRQKVSAVMGMAGACVYQYGSCSEGRPYYVRLQTFNGMDKKNAELTFDNGVKAGAIACKP